MKIKAWLAIIAAIIVCLYFIFIKKSENTAASLRVAHGIFTNFVPKEAIVETVQYQGGMEPRFGCIVKYSSIGEGRSLCARLRLVETHEGEMLRVAQEYIEMGWPSKTNAFHHAPVYVGTLSDPPFAFVYAVLGDTNGAFIF